MVFVFEKNAVPTRYYVTSSFFLTLACYNRQISLSVAVVIQFLSGVVPLAEMAGFTTFLLQLFAFRFFTLLESGHPPSSNQSFLTPCLRCQKKGGANGSPMFTS